MYNFASASVKNVFNQLPTEFLFSLSYKLIKMSISTNIFNNSIYIIGYDKFRILLLKFTYIRYIPYMISTPILINIFYFCLFMKNAFNFFNCFKDRRIGIPRTTYIVCLT